ncbi:MAG: hypothetical protein J6C25_08720 [Treponema sp.]|nr:hypothetical protein [Treponema sp.]MBP3562576.1 hypothetical protein [Treponema sp.]
MDIDVKVYLPSIFGIISGNNPLLGSRENTTDITCANLLIEPRFSIATIKRITFAWTLASGCYMETVPNSDKNAMSFNLSLGAGIYIHPFNFETYQLNGLCLFIYPGYQIPVFYRECEPYIKWKTAIDLGYNLTLASVITVYPYVKGILYWTEKDTRVAFDFGFSIGVYMHHNYQQILDEVKLENLIKL